MALVLRWTGKPLQGLGSHTIMRSSAQVDAALALEDLRRREKFARHVDNIWTKDVVDSLGKILRKKRSKKRLPVALTQLEATREV